MTLTLKLHGQFQEPPVDPDTFELMALPDVPKKRRLVGRDGVKAFGLYYRTPELERQVGKMIPVRYDPADPSYVLVELGNRWYRAYCASNKTAAKKGKS